MNAIYFKYLNTNCPSDIDEISSKYLFLWEGVTSKSNEPVLKSFYCH